MLTHILFSIMLVAVLAVTYAMLAIVAAWRLGGVGRRVL